ncbi:MAG: hypothetical protein CL556_11445 [Alphaproteobacteria bacterium]|nr:hypothetical protein [Alphaproteobacteria bacterium]MAJ64591.1 hypothetical protein [Alphaproteobacteria bacterium]|tara:strand:- start:1193 stop:1417 length:225 start_codon:yes stop_codon:yes gene_type:complete
MDKIKRQRLKLINEVSIKKGWTFGDNNPFFVEVYELMDKIEAKTMKEYMKKLKLERKKYEENAMRNYIATSLRV